METFNLDETLKTFGKINQAIYGVNPFKEKELDEAMKDYDDTHSNCCDALIVNGRCRNCGDNCK